MTYRPGDRTDAPKLTDWRAELETGVTVREVADWLPFLPPGEAQYVPKKKGTVHPKWFDTASCVSFSVAHSLEAQANYLLDSLAKPQREKLEKAGFIVSGRFDLSPRWLASTSGTTEDGNAYGRVLEVARTKGMVPVSDWPFPQTLRSFREWIQTPPDLSEKAAVWLSVFDLKYDWLFWGGDGKTRGQKLSLVASALPTCPVLVGRPWCPSCNPSKVKPGVPIEDCGVESSGHATVIYGMEDDLDQLALDTYPPFLRVFDEAYWIQHAFRAVLTIKEPAVEPEKPKVPTRNVAYGERSENVRKAQACLAYLGFLKVNPTGYYGDITADAVRRFQRSVGIKPAPSNVGPRTRAALRKALA